MNVCFTAKRAGQCGVSTIALVFSYILSRSGKRVLYVPIADSIDDILYWLGKDSERSLETNITQLCKMVESGTITGKRIMNTSLPVSPNLNMLNMEDHTLVQEKFNKLVEFILKTNAKGEEDQNDTPFDVVVFDLNHDVRTNKVKDIVFDWSDKIIDVLSNNEAIHYDKNDEYYLSEYQDKVRRIFNKDITMVYKPTLWDKINRFFNKKKLIMTYDIQIIRFQNSRTFRLYMSEIYDDSHNEQVMLGNSIKQLTKEVCNV